jgi:hypothetical protein
MRKRVVTRPAALVPAALLALLLGQSLPGHAQQHRLVDPGAGKAAPGGLTSLGGARQTAGGPRAGAAVFPVVPAGALARAGRSVAPQRASAGASTPLAAVAPAANERANGAVARAAASARQPSATVPLHAGGASKAAAMGLVGPRTSAAATGTPAVRQGPGGAIVARESEAAPGTKGPSGKETPPPQARTPASGQERARAAGKPTPGGGVQGQDAASRSGGLPTATPAATPAGAAGAQP